MIHQSFLDSNATVTCSTEETTPIYRIELDRPRSETLLERFLRQASMGQREAAVDQVRGLFYPQSRQNLRYFGLRRLSLGIF